MIAKRGALAKPVAHKEKKEKLLWVSDSATLPFHNPVVLVITGGVPEKFPTHQRVVKLALLSFIKVIQLMLLAERQSQYLVYPSWCECHFKFQDLPKLMDAAETRNHLGSDQVEELIGYGYTPDYPPIRTVEGKFGGGLIIIDVPLGTAFIGLPRLFEFPEEKEDEEDGICPVSLRDPLTDEARIGEKFPFSVSYLEHETYPFVGKKVKLYLCRCTVENIKSDHERTYWAFEYTGGKNRPPQFEEMVELAAPFCSSIKLIEILPPEVEQETSPWFKFPDRQQVWFEITPKETGAGFNYAAFVYVTYHLRWTIGSKLKSGHLVANIEQSPPNIRINWPVP